MDNDIKRLKALRAELKLVQAANRAAKKEARAAKKLLRDNQKASRKSNESSSLIEWKKTQTPNAICSLETFDAVIKKTSEDFRELVNFYYKKGLVKSTKQLSEDISGLLETNASRVLENTIAPKKDHEPDLYVNGIPVEIKTTSGDAWSGGEYSKRESYYLLVKWQLSGNDLLMFVVGTYLKKSDWTSSKPGSNSYRTTFNKSNIDSKNKANELDIYHGSVIQYNRGSFNPVKMICHEA